tara:strand:+ start:1208 stop:1387 length:180 start_codon:yes stop_codon:yes gene_type:complete
MFEMMELGIEMQKAVREVQLKQLDAAGEALDAMQRGAAETMQRQARAWNRWRRFWGGGE